MMNNMQGMGMGRGPMGPGPQQNGMPAMGGRAPVQQQQTQALQQHIISKSIFMFTYV
jgi:hypothetical protein